MRLISLKRSTGFLFAVLFLGFATASQAQQLPALRIGYTDHEVLISNMPQTRTIQEELQAELESGQRILQSMQEDLAGKVERYQTQRALLSEERRQEREQELISLEEELRSKAGELEQELVQRELDLMGPIYQQVDTAIQTIAAEKNLDLVLRTQAGPAQPILLYVNEDRITDITLEVARELGIDVDAAMQAAGN
ncbi:MAG: OmpH family outer membrane protein [Rhodothermaceae bacterium]|nr:OmpH family outer membrane protein [Bacteroidota bacterium]MXW13883.1 OmpH family outer membrane protein [Rhodothermaceae bacterium]MCY3630571.1 OmpH family outer membrane protein [Bacteroidota bacterium]MXX97322.1 OmpH family outer membrane protein [Rhodothermaceae bacterium]MXZ58886.1 OmpH family outer membrane protein [Rhodothermaceae bacterium]